MNKRISVLEAQNIIKKEIVNCENNCDLENILKELGFYDYIVVGIKN